MAVSVTIFPDKYSDGTANLRSTTRHPEPNPERRCTLMQLLGTLGTFSPVILFVDDTFSTAISEAATLEPPPPCLSTPPPPPPPPLSPPSPPALLAPSIRSKVVFKDGRVYAQNRFVATDSWDPDAPEGKGSAGAVRGWTPRPGGWLKNAFKMPGKLLNTSVMFKGGKLYALSEGSKPSEMDPVTLETLEESDLGGIQVTPRRFVVGDKTLADSVLV